MNNLKNVHLTKLSIKLGANFGTNKSSKLSNLDEQIKLLDKLHTQFTEKGKLNILAMDSGVVNFAYIKTTIEKDWSLSIKFWNKLQLENKFNDGVKLSLQPKSFTPLTQKLYKFITTDAIGENTDIYLLERQRIRTQSSKFVTDPIIKINFLEQLIYYSWTNQGKTIISSDPIKLCQLYPNEKKERISVVKSLIQGIKNDQGSSVFMDKMSLTKEMSTYLANNSNAKKFKIFDFLQLKEPSAGPNKDDDLADCLLHTLSWKNWLYNYNRLKSNNFDFQLLLQK